MALEKYQAKRKFDSTPEPKGKVARSNRDLKFVVQRHQASRLHYDFRLEMDGVLKSWAVPKGPSLDPGDRRLAMMVEDHPMDYRDFEGVIPEGNYGAGTVMVWDEGTYTDWDHSPRPKAEKILKQGLHKGHITFVMDGHKLKGEFALVRLRNAEDSNAWLLLKKGDTEASERDILKKDKSVISSKSMAELAKSSAKWTPAGKLDLAEAPKRAMPSQIKPMLATLVDKPFDREGWLFEVKWDGYRILAHCDGAKVNLFSRNHKDYTAVFAPVAEELRKLKLRAVLDGEMVAVDERGRSSFQLLQNFQKTGEGRLLFYVFDLLWQDGHDLSGLPLLKRKAFLRQLTKDHPHVKLSDDIAEKGVKFFRVAADQGLEGIIAKDAAATYHPGARGPWWLKVKTGREQEIVIGGFTEPRGGRKAIGAVVGGVYEDGQLIEIGSIGTGFDEKGWLDLKDKLEKLKSTKSPFAKPPKTRTAVTWVKPKLLAQVKFAEWTGDGHLRQPIILGIRSDKSPKSVKREEPVSADISKSSSGGEDNNVLLRIGGKQLKLTNLNKVYWPDEGYTKGELIEYYRLVAKLILPHLKSRPESLNRHPHGINGDSFYQKNIETAPDWAKTVKIHSGGEDRDINYLICDDEATLVYMANLGCIEINPWLSRIKKPEHPDFCVIDLDPEDISFTQVVKTAQAVHRLLEELDIEAHPKTSGATGIHIYIPLGAKYTYDQSKQFAELIARLVNKRLPDITSVVRDPKKRQQRVYLDFLQNRKGQTLASAYSARPKPGATVSTPLDWDEVTPKLDPADFTIKNALKRFDKVGDLWKPTLGRGIKLLAALKKIEQLSSQK